MAQTHVDLSADEMARVDATLTDVVQAVQAAVAWGMNKRQDRATVAKAVADCRELIRQVMDATVLTW